MNKEEYEKHKQYAGEKKPSMLRRRVMNQMAKEMAIIYCLPHYGWYFVKCPTGNCFSFRPATVGSPPLRGGDRGGVGDIWERETDGDIRQRSPHPWPLPFRGGESLAMGSNCIYFPKK